MANTIARKQGNSSVLYDTTWVPAKGSWIAYAGLTPADYQAKKADALSKGFKETAIYTCNTNSGQLKCTVLRKP